jgi:hypothetical protein
MKKYKMVALMPRVLDQDQGFLEIIPKSHLIRHELTLPSS